jgi:hypothetical protein
VTEAWTEYELASAEFDKALDRKYHGFILPPDGPFAGPQTRLQQSAALSEYLRVLRIFTDLLVSGKIPEKSKTA